MKIEWTKSVANRIYFGMFILLISTFGISYWTLTTVNSFSALSKNIASEQLPILSTTQKIESVISDINNQINALSYVQHNKVHIRVAITKLTEKITFLEHDLNSVSGTYRRQAVIELTKDIRKIINSYGEKLYELSELETKYAQQLTLVEQTLLLLAQENLSSLANKVSNNASTQVNQAYFLVQKLNNLQNNFQITQTELALESLLNKQTNSVEWKGLNDLITNKRTGLVTQLQQLKMFEHTTTALNVQSNILIEQLKYDINYYLKERQDEVMFKTDELTQSAEQLTFTLIIALSISFIVMVLLMLVIKTSLINRIIAIANSIGTDHAQTTLKQIAAGHSEVSYIAQALQIYIATHEQQNSTILKQNQQFQYLIENTNQAVMIFDERGIVFCNDFCRRLLDLSYTHEIIPIPESLAKVTKNHMYSTRMQLGDKWFRPFATDIVWENTNSRLLLLTDISSEVANEQVILSSLAQATDDAFTDSLTGLYNRRKLEAMFKEKSDSHYTMIVLDIDWFKYYNDINGHEMGDTCIQKVATAIRSTMRKETDFAFRYGGEEFVILLLDSDNNHVLHIADRIQNNVRALCIPHQKSIYSMVTVSMGIAHSKEISNPDWKSIFNIADKRLYKAKANGRAQIVSDDIS